MVWIINSVNALLYPRLMQVGIEENDTEVSHPKSKKSQAQTESFKKYTLYCCIIIRGINMNTSYIYK